VTVQYSVTTGLTALAAATAKSMVEVNPGSGLPAELISMDVSSSYATSATPITLLIELVSNTATGTGTTYTPKRYGQAVGVAQSTTKINDTVEPSTPTVIQAWELVLPSGPFSYQWPLGREYLLTTSSFNAIRCTASAVCSVIVNAVIEE
jgi:hypothetical protein